MDLAIVGIGCRLPGGASDPAAFWTLLERGVDAITELPADRFDVDAVYDPDPSRPGHIYSRWGGFVGDVDRFDADFFGIAPREAKRMDPQHRLLLEVTWEALEDGGQAPDRLAGSSTGVFVGISTHDYSDLHIQPGQRALLDAHVNIGNALCAAPNRISYLLDLHGPSMAIETACSSSLTAVHLARRSMMAGDCDLAIAGGVNLILAPDLTIGFCKASMISPDGRCHAFDAGANGYVRSEGAGIVVLKPLERAQADRDRIHAVIRSTAINEDGRTAGISLPNADAQARLLQRALEEADVDPATIDYVEAHGTGTEVGDPAEAEALGRVIGRTRALGDELVVGSAKTNVGHLEAGAGVTGLIKAALMLRARRIPPSLHLERPNPRIPFAELGLRIPTALEPWPETDHPARAGAWRRLSGRCTDDGWRRVRPTRRSTDRGGTHRGGHDLRPVHGRTGAPGGLVHGRRDRARGRTPPHRARRDRRATAPARSAIFVAGLRASPDRAGNATRRAGPRDRRPRRQRGRPASLASDDPVPQPPGDARPPARARRRGRRAVRRPGREERRRRRRLDLGGVLPRWGGGDGGPWRAPHHAAGAPRRRPRRGAGPTPR
jgi:3-oxoacyl-(acyl-carrier-protein) synthase